MQAIIDRESDLAVYGTFIMEISATEVDNVGNRGQSVLTEVTIIVTVSNKCCSHTLCMNLKLGIIIYQDTPTPQYTHYFYHLFIIHFYSCWLVMAVITTSTTHSYYGQSLQ